MGLRAVGGVVGARGLCVCAGDTGVDPARCVSCAIYWHRQVPVQRHQRAFVTAIAFGLAGQHAVRRRLHRVHDIRDPRCCVSRGWLWWHHRVL